jgi:Protein of unknown function (DUF3575)
LSEVLTEQKLHNNNTQWQKCCCVFIYKHFEISWRQIHPMKKAIFFLSVLFCLQFSSYSQEVGYNTTDIGAEFGHSTGDNVFNLHVAFNSKLHHSFIVRIGYNSVTEEQSAVLKNEKGGGVIAGLGYRYFFAYRPHFFFLGARVDYRNLNVEWSDTNSGGKYKLSNYFIGAETGFKFLINDQVFITPTVGLGIISGKEEGLVQTGFTVLPGISAGVQF